MVLSRLQNGQPAVVDFLEYSGLGPDQSFGWPDPWREDAVPQGFTTPTPGGANESSPPPAPRLLSLQLEPSGAATLRWTATPGAAYRLEAAAGLNPAVWRPAGDVTASMTEATLTDTGNLEAQQQFYRVRLMP